MKKKLLVGLLVLVSFSSFSFELKLNISNLSRVGNQYIHINDIGYKKNDFKRKKLVKSLIGLAIQNWIGPHFGLPFFS